MRECLEKDREKEKKEIEREGENQRNICGAKGMRGFESDSQREWKRTLDLSSREQNPCKGPAMVVSLHKLMGKT